MNKLPKSNFMTPKCLVSNHRLIKVTIFFKFWNVWFIFIVKKKIFGLIESGSSSNRKKLLKNKEKKMMKKT